MLTNGINFLGLLSQLGVYLFHPWPICNVSLLLGMAFVILVQRFPLSIVISVRGLVQIEVSYCANRESNSFSSPLSFVSIFCSSLWQGGLKVSGITFSAVILSVVILYIVCSSGISVDCDISLWVDLDGLCILFCWTCYAYWCNLIWQYSQMFPFYVVYAIYNVYIRILPFCWILIADEIWCTSFNCMAFDLDQNEVIMSGWYFESWLHDPYSWLLFTISSVSEKSAILLYWAVLLLIPGIWQGKFFSGYQLQMVVLCLVVCCL